MNTAPAATANSLAKPGDDTLSDPEIVFQAVLRAMRLVRPGENRDENFEVLDNHLVKVVDPSVLDLDKWTESLSTHTDDNGAREIDIPGHRGYVLKYYVDSKFGPTIVVTVGPTLAVSVYSVEHAKLAAEEWFLQRVNLSLNSWIARKFLGIIQEPEFETWSPYAP